MSSNPFVIFVWASFCGLFMFFVFLLVYFCSTNIRYVLLKTYIVRFSLCANANIKIQT